MQGASFRRRWRHARTAIRKSRGPESRWFWQHYAEAAEQILDAFGSLELSLRGKQVADIGCGDGFVDLGLLHKAKPRRVVGYDVNLTNVDHLRRRAREEGVSTQMDGLEFVESAETAIPGGDGEFDYAFSWSAFEHIERPVEVLKEIRRILAPEGVFFLQLWPFYFSARGSHLWEWFPAEHHHLQRPESAVARELESSTAQPEEWTGIMSQAFQHLNRITVDELQRSVLAAGFVVRRVELLTDTTVIAPELARYSWLDLAVGGVKLIATKR